MNTKVSGLGTWRLAVQLTITSCIVCYSATSICSLISIQKTILCGQGYSKNLWTGSLKEIWTHGIHSDKHVSKESRWGSRRPTLYGLCTFLSSAGQIASVCRKYTSLSSSAAWWPPYQCSETFLLVPEVKEYDNRKKIFRRDLVLYATVYLIFVWQRKLNTGSRDELCGGWGWFSQVMETLVGRSGRNRSGWGKLW